MARKRYHNLDDVSLTHGLSDIRKWQKERAAKKKDLSFVVPQAERAVQSLQETMATGKPAITWIGHSTFLIAYKDRIMVTDPVWAGQMGVQKRLAPPGIPLDELPEIHHVLISHSHYDHLHLRSIRRLKGYYELLVPAGLDTMLRRQFRRVTALNWWEQTEAGGVEFTFVPAQHWTKRKLWSTNDSHWGGWIIGEPAADAAGSYADVEHRRRLPTIYFVGDSGYFRGFKEIGERYAPHIVLMPIGAYEPEWFMSAQHVSPEEAVQAFLDTGAEIFVPMHYGAFRLADDTPQEALDRLHHEWRRRGLDPGRLKVLQHGETWQI